MSFDWERFFDQHGIEYVRSGPNVGRGELGIRCPFCGAADKSQHMSVNLEGRGWFCRRRQHSGHSPVGLVRALLGCSFEEAKRVVGDPVLPAVAGLLGRVRDMLARPDEAPAPAELREPPEFRALSDKPSCRPFLRYLVDRGFRRDFLLRDTEELDLCYAVRGPFGGRVIFLVRDEGRLVTWTGRTISGRQRRRYDALTTAPEFAARQGLQPAAATIGDCLLWQDELARPRSDALCLVEGPMDALKLRMLAGDLLQPHAVFTNALSVAQVGRLREAAPRFRHRLLLLDRGAEGRALRARESLAALGFRVRWLPEGVDDPGELSPKTFAKLALDSLPELRL